MAVRHEALTETETAHQESLERSWLAANEALADADVRARLQESLERVNESRSSETMSKVDFLAATESSIE